jgi:hypothetical protein
VFNSGILPIRVLPRVLISRVGCNLGRNLLRDEPMNAVGVGPGNISKLVIESLENIGEVV